MDHGAVLGTVAGAFLGSSEFQTTYGALDDALYVTQLYMNVLHRGPDHGGQDFWTGHLSAHDLTRTDVSSSSPSHPRTRQRCSVRFRTQNGIQYLPFS